MSKNSWRDQTLWWNCLKGWTWTGLQGCSFEGGHPCWDGLVGPWLPLGHYAPVSRLTVLPSRTWVRSLLWSVLSAQYGKPICLPFHRKWSSRRHVPNSLWVTGLQSPLRVSYILTSVSFTVLYKIYYQLSKHYHQQENHIIQLWRSVWLISNSVKNQGSPRWQTIIAECGLIFSFLSASKMRVK